MATDSDRRGASGIGPERSRSSPGSRAHGSPTAPLLPYRNCSRCRMRGRTASGQRAASLLRCSGSTRCSTRFGTIRVSKTRRCARTEIGEQNNWQPYGRAMNKRRGRLCALRAGATRNCRDDSTSAREIPAGLGPTAISRFNPCWDDLRGDPRFDRSSRSQGCQQIFDSALDAEHSAFDVFSSE